MTPAAVAGLALRRAAAGPRGPRSLGAFDRGGSTALGGFDALRRAAGWLGEVLAPQPRLRREPLWGEALARLTAEPAVTAPPQAVRRPATGVPGHPDEARLPAAARGGDVGGARRLAAAREVATAGARESRQGETAGRGNLPALRRPGRPGPPAAVAPAARAGEGLGTKRVAAPRAFPAAEPPRRAGLPLLEILAGRSPLAGSSSRARTRLVAAVPG